MFVNFMWWQQVKPKMNPKNQLKIEKYMKETSICVSSCTPSSTVTSICVSSLTSSSTKTSISAFISTTSTDASVKIFAFTSSFTMKREYGQKEPWAQECCKHKCSRNVPGLYLRKFPKTPPYSNGRDSWLTTPLCTKFLGSFTHINEFDNCIRIRAKTFLAL